METESLYELCNRAITQLFIQRRPRVNISPKCLRVVNGGGFIRPTQRRRRTDGRGKDKKMDGVWRRLIPLVTTCDAAERSLSGGFCAFGSKRP